VSKRITGLYLIFEKSIFLYGGDISVVLAGLLIVQYGGTHAMRLYRGG
jgi:hypothetical protein